VPSFWSPELGKSYAVVRTELRTAPREAQQEIVVVGDDRGRKGASAGDLGVLVAGSTIDQVDHAVQGSQPGPLTAPEHETLDPGALGIHRLLGCDAAQGERCDGAWKLAFGLRRDR